MKRALPFLLALYVLPGTALGFDPLDTVRSLPPPPPMGGAPLDPSLAGDTACPGARAPDAGNISLDEVVLRTLCADPRTRQTWAAVRLQAAQLGIARAAWLPRVDATATTYRYGERLSQGVAASRSDQHSRDLSLDLSWTLFDFGQRSAAVDSARRTLLAATASRDATLQQVFLDAATSYYDLLLAQGTLSVAQEVERINLQSFLAAEAKHGAGVGALSEQLQTQTAFAQAILSRSKAEGALRDAQGRLALRIGEAPTLPLAVDPDDARLPDLAFITEVGQMLDAAREKHPGLRAARARLDASRARLAAAERAHAPSVSLVANATRNSTDYKGQSDPLDKNAETLGVRIDIPLFDGFGRHYQVRAARAEMEQATAELDDAEQSVAREVWQSWQALQTETQTVENTGKLLDFATKSLEIAQGRYKAGVGSTLELLDAQRVMADAAQQRIGTLANWRLARLRLAASLGKLGFWSVAPPSP
ncbi:TolC family protein [Cognatazoarcus halotolerans]|uniref:TolC family protein n=1 Tax=Cognatazoarcus halotolerans TaxID=2686016 RepID=UPI001357A774|nr:TolC family protein [Cognatazoarcus halotolerans]MCB1902382.1 TolC family protein [Rhodocyclaceae bacterium]MCP5310164.1 TolC family protein [Zoogloeaceae bacterium]